MQFNKYPIHWAASHKSNYSMVIGRSDTAGLPQTVSKEQLTPDGSGVMIDSTVGIIPRDHPSSSPPPEYKCSSRERDNGEAQSQDAARAPEHCCIVSRRTRGGEKWGVSRNTKVRYFSRRKWRERVALQERWWLFFFFFLCQQTGCARG